MTFSNHSARQTGRMESVAPPQTDRHPAVADEAPASATRTAQNEEPGRVKFDEPRSAPQHAGRADNAPANEAITPTPATGDAQALTGAQRAALVQYRASPDYPPTPRLTAAQATIKRIGSPDQATNRADRRAWTAATAAATELDRRDLAELHRREVEQAETRRHAEAANRAALDAIDNFLADLN